MFKIFLFDLFGSRRKREIREINELTQEFISLSTLVINKIDERLAKIEKFVTSLDFTKLNSLLKKINMLESRFEKLKQTLGRGISHIETTSPPIPTSSLNPTATVNIAETNISKDIRIESPQIFDTIDSSERKFATIKEELKRELDILRNMLRKL